MTAIVDLYCRVSTDEQVKEGYSLEAQEKRLRLYAESMGWIVNRCYIDGGYSGKNLERPGMQSLILDAKAHRVNKVCVVMLDRLSRSQKDTMWLIEDVFLANNVDFVSMHETLDTSTPVGRAMIGVLAVFAQLERDQITERLSTGRTARVQSGLYRGGGKTPIGYTYDAEHDTLVVDPATATVVQTIFRMYNEGNTLGAIAKAINSDPSIVRSNYSSSHIGRILDNPIYVGKMRWNGDIIDMTNPVTIIDDDTYNAAQSRRNASRTGAKQSGVIGATLLSGIVWCGICGRRFSYSDDPRMSKHPKRRYCCSSRRSFSKRVGIEPCKNKKIPCDELDGIVINEIRQLIADRSLLDQRAQAENMRENERNMISKRLNEIDTQLGRLIDLYMLGRFDPSQLTARTDQLTTERDALIERMAGLNDEDTPKTDYNAILDKFADLVDNVDKRELASVIRSLINKITITGDDIAIEWAFR